MIFVIIFILSIKPLLNLDMEDPIKFTCFYIENNFDNFVPYEKYSQV